MENEWLARKHRHYSFSIFHSPFSITPTTSNLSVRPSNNDQYSASLKINSLVFSQPRQGSVMDLPYTPSPGF